MFTYLLCLLLRVWQKFTGRFDGYTTIAPQVLKVHRLWGLKRPFLFETKVGTRSCVLPKRGVTPNIIKNMEGRPLYVPTFEIATHPTISYTQNSLRYRLKAMGNALESLDLQMDRSLVALLEKVDEERPGARITSVGDGKLRPSTLDMALRSLADTSHCLAGAIILHPSMAEDMRSFGMITLSRASEKERQCTGVFARYLGIPIYVTDLVQKNKVYVVGKPEKFGTLLLSGGTKVKTVDSPTKLRMGWVLWRSIGEAIFDQRAVKVIHYEEDRSTNDYDESDYDDVDIIPVIEF